MFHTTRVRVPNRPASALSTIADIHPGDDVLLDAVADSDGDAEVIVATTSPSLTLDDDASIRHAGRVLHLATDVTTHPERVIHVRVFGFLKHRPLAHYLKQFQLLTNLSAHAVRYHRVNTNELHMTEHAELVFAEEDSVKVHALIEHLAVLGFHSVPSESNALGASGHPRLILPAAVSERHVLHVHAGAGLAANLHWQAHKHRVELKETRGMEADGGAAVIIGIDGPKRNRSEFLMAVQHHIDATREHTPHGLHGERSLGRVWVEATSPHGGAMRLTAKVAQHGLSFRYLQTGRDGSSDLLQGILDVGHKHAWHTCRHLKAWAGQHHVQLHTHILSGANQDPNGDGHEPLTDAA